MQEKFIDYKLNSTKNFLDDQFHWMKDPQLIV